MQTPLCHVLSTRAALPPVVIPEKRLPPKVFTGMPLGLTANHLGVGSVMLLRQTCHRLYSELLGHVAHTVKLHIGFASTCAADTDEPILDKIAAEVRLPAIVRDEWPAITGQDIVCPAAIERSMEQFSQANTRLDLLLHPYSSDSGGMLFMTKTRAVRALSAYSAHAYNCRYLCTTAILNAMAGAGVHLNVYALDVAAYALDVLPLGLAATLAPTVRVLRLHEHHCDDDADARTPAAVHKSFAHLTHLHTLDIDIDTAYAAVQPALFAIFTGIASVSSLQNLTIRGGVLYSDDEKLVEPRRLAVQNFVAIRQRNGNPLHVILVGDSDTCVPAELMLLAHRATKLHVELPVDFGAEEMRVAHLIDALVAMAPDDVALRAFSVVSHHCHDADVAAAELALAQRNQRVPLHRRIACHVAQPPPAPAAAVPVAAVPVAG